MSSQKPAPTPVETGESDNLSYYFVVIPLLLGVGLLTAAIVWTLASEDTGFFGFLLMLIGGWSLGFSFVNLTMDIRPALLGTLLHLGVAALITAIMLVLVESKGSVLEGLSEQARAVVLVLQLAVTPAAAWIWLGLLSRVSDLFTRRNAKKKRSDPVAPDWEREERGDGSGVSFAAIEMRMRTLTLTIIGIVVVVGAIGVTLLIALDIAGVHFGPRMAVILMGIVLGLPAYLIFVSIVRRRQIACTVAFGNDELRIRMGDVTHVIPYRDLELLLWRSRTDYARVEVRGAGVDLSLMTGLAKQATGKTAELPELPRRVFRRFEIYGLTVEKSRRDEVITFRRTTEPAAEQV